MPRQRPTQEIELVGIICDLGLIVAHALNPFPQKVMASIKPDYEIHLLCSTCPNLYSFCVCDNNRRLWLTERAAENLFLEMRGL